MIKPDDLSMVNITLKLPNSDLVALENYLNSYYNLIDFSVIVDTSKMYEQDATFKKIVQEAKKIKDLRLQYINDNNYKYKYKND